MTIKGAKKALAYKESSIDEIENLSIKTKNIKNKIKKISNIIKELKIK